MDAFGKEITEESKNDEGSQQADYANEESKGEIQKKNNHLD